MLWALELRGGDYDGWGGSTEAPPGPVIVAWRCGEHSDCEGHASFDVNDPKIIIARAQAYTLTDADESTRVAVYDVGDVTPGGEIEEAAEALVGASAMHGAGALAVQARPKPTATWVACATAADDGVSSGRALAIAMLMATAWVIAGVVVLSAGVL